MNGLTFLCHLPKIENRLKKMEILVEKILLARQDSPLYKHLAPFLSLIRVLRGKGLRKNYSYLYILISYIIVKLYPGTLELSHNSTLLNSL